ncbi:MAG TPA: hypothetical protein VF170_19495 [Planctomycetaceae bacterium]
MALRTPDTTIMVPEDRTVTPRLPPEVSVGPHRIIVIVEEPEPAVPPKSLAEAFPVIPGAQWSEGTSLRREDMYGDDGR